MPLGLSSLINENLGVSLKKCKELSNGVFGSSFYEILGVY